MTFAAIVAYISGILFFVFWIYLNTKIVFSFVPKERFALRVIAWGSIGLISFVFVYALFMIFVMLLVFVENTFLGLTA